jgi:integral membrane protein (TIGR00529 family)
MIETLLNAPALLKILISLAAIIVMNKLISNQILGVLSGIIILALWSGHSFSNSFSIAWVRFSNLDNLFLLLVVFIIIVLSSQMKESGMMADLVKSITQRFSRNRSMAILPAVIGLLPMPGGAIFSAPLVGSCDQNDTLDPSLKTRINYWFRHVWEYWWPLYPGVLLAIEISGLSVPAFMVFMFPISLFSIAGAWFFLMRKTGKDIRPDSSTQKSSFRHFLFLVSPIIIVMGSYSILGSALPVLSEVSRYLPIAIGIILSIIYLQIIRPLNLASWKKMFNSRIYFNMVVLVALIRIYGAFIEGRLPDGTLMMEALRLELAEAGISSYLLIMLIPLVCGISTGIAIGTVGAAFPIVISLIGPDPSFSLLVSTTVLAYAFGHVGQLLSPVHVCLLVSNEYFKVGLVKSLLGILKPSLVVLAAGILLSRLYLAVL